MSLLCHLYVISKFRNHLITSQIQQLLCHMSLVFKISAKKFIKMTVERLPCHQIATNRNPFSNES